MSRAGIGLDLVLVPRSLVLAVQALLRSAQRSSLSKEELPLYAIDDEDRDEVEE